MASQKRKLEVVIAGDAKGLDRAFGKADKSAKGFGSSFGKVAKGVAAAGAAVFAADRLIDWGGQLVSLGNQVENWRAKTQTVFEDQTDAVNEWADANNEALGVTSDELAGLAAGFGDLLKPMGFTAEEAANMSTEVLDLSGALSAWSGGQRSAAEVSNILSKAMLGEREQLKELGISISEAEVQNRLLEKGQKALTGEALAQAKALATQELIFEKSTDAQEAWADGTFDNIKAQNEMRATFAEVRETLAEKLLPVFNAAVGFLNDNVIPVVSEVVDVFGKDGLAGVIDFLSEGLKQAWPQIRETLSNLAMGLWEWIQDAYPRAQTALFRFLRSLGEWLVGTGLPMWVDWLQEMAPVLWQWIQEATPPALRQLAAWIGDLVDWFIDEGGPALVDGISQMLGALWEWLSGDGFDLWVENMSNIASATWEWIKDVTPLALRALGRMLVSLVGWMVDTALPAIVRTVASWARALYNWIGDAVRALPGRLVEILRTIGGWIVFTAAPAIARAAAAMASAMVNWVVDAVRDIPYQLARLASTILGWIGSMPGRIASAARGMWNGLYNSFIDAINGIIRRWNDLEFRIPGTNIGFGTPDVGLIGSQPVPSGGGRTVRRFHTGGTFQAPRSGGEGLALLRDGERITPPREGDGGAGGMMTVQLVVDGRVLGESLVNLERRQGPLPITVQAVAG